MAHWIDPSLLLGEDLDSILSAVYSLNLDHKQLQKYSSYYLSKVFTKGEVKWGPVASQVLVFLATSTPLVIEDQDHLIRFFSSSPDKWLERIKVFRRVTAEKRVTRDCVFQLFKTHVLSITDIAQQPTMLAQLAHRMNVHGYMALRIDGASPVSHCLKMDYKKGAFDKKFRVNFFASLHQAFKSDFTYIIGPGLEEFRCLVNGKIKSVANYFKQTGANFRALDYALSYLASQYVEPLLPYYTPQKQHWPQKASSMENAVNAALEGQSKLLSSTWEKLDATVYVLRQHTGLIEATYNRTLKTYALQGIVTPHAEFPVHNLPVEIIEHIITIDEEMTEAIRPLFCVSRQMNAIKGKIKWREHIRRRFPLKYRMIESKITDWGGYYIKENSYECNWRTGKFRQFEVDADVHDMNGDIILAEKSFRQSFPWEAKESAGPKKKIIIHESQKSSKPAESTGSFYNYQIYWQRLSELENEDETQNYYCLDSKDKVSGYEKACLVASPSNQVRVARISSTKFHLFEGMDEIASVTYSQGNYEPVNGTMTKLDRVFTGAYEVILDDRLTHRKLFEHGGQVTDLNIFNGQRICSETEQEDIGWRQKTELFVRSKDNEVIGQLIQAQNIESVFEYSVGIVKCDRSVFLDEYTIVAFCSRDKLPIIAYVDTRKLGDIYAEIRVDDSAMYFDATGRRALGVHSSNVVNVYDLDTKQRLNIMPGNDMMISNLKRNYIVHNARYWCLEGTRVYTSLYDFGVSNSWDKA